MVMIGGKALTAAALLLIHIPQRFLLISTKKGGDRKRWKKIWPVLFVDIRGIAYAVWQPLHPGKLGEYIGFFFSSILLIFSYFCRRACLFVCLSDMIIFKFRRERNNFV